MTSQNAKTSVLFTLWSALIGRANQQQENLHFDWSIKSKQILISNFKRSDWLKNVSRTVMHYEVPPTVTSTKCEKNSTFFHISQNFATCLDFLLHRNHFNISRHIQIASPKHRRFPKYVGVMQSTWNLDRIIISVPNNIGKYAFYREILTHGKKRNFFWTSIYWNFSTDYCFIY